MTIQGGIVEYVNPAAHLTVTAGAAITGGQLVKLSGNRTVIPTVAVADHALGVALWTAASGDTNLSVASLGVWPLTAAGAIAAGDFLVPGTVAGTTSTLAAVTTPTAADVTNTRSKIGIALEAIADTATGRVKLRL